MAVDLATMRDQHIDVDFVGKFGMMPAQDATPLSLVLRTDHQFGGTRFEGRGGSDISRFPWAAVAITPMRVVEGMMAPVWRMRSMMAWLAFPIRAWNMIIKRSSPMILAERCIGSHVAVVVPVRCLT